MSKRRNRRKCEICGIREAQLTDDSIHFAVFPREENRCREWLRIVGNEELVHLPIEKLRQLKCVCSLHFKRRDFNKLGNRLKRHAVPSHDLPVPPLTESQLANFPQRIKSQGSSDVLFDQKENKENNVLQAVPSGSVSGVRFHKEEIKLPPVTVSVALLDHNYCSSKENVPPITEHQGTNKRAGEILDEVPVKVLKTAKVSAQVLVSEVRYHKEKIKQPAVTVSVAIQDHDYCSSKKNVPPVTEHQGTNKRACEVVDDVPAKVIKTTTVSSQVLVSEARFHKEEIKVPSVTGSDALRDHDYCFSKENVPPVTEHQGTNKRACEIVDDVPAKVIKTTTVSSQVLALRSQQDHSYGNLQNNLTQILEHQGATRNKRAGENLCDEEEPSKKMKTTPVPSQELGMLSKIEELTKKLKETKCNLMSLKKSAKLIENLKSDVLKDIVTSALTNQNKKPKGRRWTMKNKISALSIFKRSPKTYRFLRHLIPLPSTKTLNNILGKIPFETGINRAVLNQLKAVSTKLNKLDKYCAISFDEIALKPKLQYNASSDKIEGFEDTGNESGDRTSQIADHALVFMLKGVRKNIKQPLAYYFVKGTISSEKLSVIIKDVIKAVEETGFIVLTTVCDQGPTNMGALKLLKDMSCLSTVDNYFLLDKKKVFIVYDVPHLFKSLRNNFLNNGEIIMSDKKGKWSHLKKVEEKNRNFLYLSKLTHAHVSPKYRQKMKVKYAAQMLSCTVSAVLKLMAQAENDAELLATGEIVKELDTLFDATNGPSGPKDVKKGQRENVSKKTNHLELWTSFEKKLKTVKFQKPNGQVAKNVKCINGYLTTLKSLKDIWLIVDGLGFKYLNLRNLNQDSLENMFGVIRQHSPTNKNPTCSCFIAALKTNVLSGMTAPHSKGNCEQDNSKIITDFKEIIFGVPSQKDKSVQDQKETTPTVSIDEGNFTFMLSIADVEEEIEEMNCFDKVDDQPIVYVSGYVAATLLKNNSCQDCQESLTIIDPGNAPCYEYIRLREWWEDKKSFKYPSISLCKLVESTVNIFNESVAPVLHLNGICQLCVTHFMAQCDTNFIKCNIHHDGIVNKIFIRLALLFIRRQCQRINQSISQHEEISQSAKKRAQQIGTSSSPS